MKKRYKILTIAFFCIFLLPSNAQQMEEPRSLLSPNVATLGTFREPDVALYTGTPSISIPLFEVPLQDYVLPIELQYNGTSILVDQRPSWVGLGWNLSAGGVITRKVNDMPDDLRYSSDWCDYNYSYNDCGFYYHYYALDTTCWNTFWLKDWFLDQPSENVSYLEAYDTEPDEFSFTFPGYSGRFYFNHKRQLEVQCAKSVSVQLISATMYPPFPILNSQWYGGHLQKQPPCFAGFIVTIDNGTQFVFGNYTSAIDFCADFYEPYQTFVANAWHLTKIVLPNKQEISFTYQRKNFTNQMYYAEIIREEHEEASGILDPPCSNFSGMYDSERCIHGKLLSPVYLRKISTPTLDVTFSNSVAHDLQYSDNVYWLYLNYELDSHTKYFPYLTNFTDYMGEGIEYYYLDSIHGNLKRYKLDSISIHSSSYKKTICLEYIENDSTRLALSNVRLADGGTYHFTYHELERLPKYIAFKMDHWGYYNNVYSRLFGYIDTCNYYSKRETNPTYAKYGLLTNMYHPTGAKTQFEYESNDYQKQVAEARWNTLVNFDSKHNGGGARIRKISHFENANDVQPILTKEYFYKINYINNPSAQVSSGIMGNRFQYRYEYSENSNNNNPIYQKIFSSSSVLPQSDESSSVCYSEVTEKISSGGYTVYKFSNYSEQLDEIPLSCAQASQLKYGKYISTRMYRGLLLSKEEYNGQREKLHKVCYTYTPNKSANHYVRALDWRYYDSCKSSSGYDEGCAYILYTHTMVPDTIREVTYSANGDSIVKITKYTYDIQHQMPIHIKHMSLTDTISEKIIYPFDICPQSTQGQNVSAEAQTCIGMVQNHYYLPWEITSYKTGKVVGSTCFHYSTYSNEQQTYYARDSISVLGITEPLGFTSFSQISPSQKDSRYIVPAKQSCRYNEHGNVIEIITDGIPVSYVWGYNDSYVVAKIVGLHYSQVQSIIPAYWFTEFNLSAGPSIGMLSAMRAEIKSHYPLAQCYAYQYNPLFGLISETDPRGQTLFYDYDAMGRLKEVYYKENNTKRVVKKYLYHHKHFESIQPL